MSDAYWERGTLGGVPMARIGGILCAPMTRRTMTMIGGGSGVLLVLLGGAAWWVFRGAAPAFLPPPANIAAIIRRTPTNATGMPLTLPPGFSIGIFASELGKPRVLHMGPRGELLVSVPEDGHVLALRDRDGDGAAEERAVVVTGLRKPHGIVTWEQDGRWKLFVAAEDRVLAFDYDPDARRAANPTTLTELPVGGQHVTRSLSLQWNPRVDTPPRLLVSVGSSCNICQETDARRAAILSMNLDGSDVRPFATGLRNSVFMAHAPWTRGGPVWATEMGQDFLGDALPPDEINIVEEGSDYGWPYCYGKNVRNAFDVRRRVACDMKAPSHIDLPAHVAPLGLAFIPEIGWPKGWGNDLLVAYHGSWNRSSPTGYEIVRVRLAEYGARVVGIEDFISGWRVSDQRALGRPVDLLAQPNGTLYISDDHAGVIYRVTYDPSVWVDDGQEGKPPDRSAGGCVITGCSGQVCADREVMTTCEYRPEYACYANERCERQENGSCGWVATEALRSCLDRTRRPSFPGT